MDAREHRALLCALVVLGCCITGFPSLVTADGSTTGAGTTPFEPTEQAVESVTVSGPSVIVLNETDDDLEDGNETTTTNESTENETDSSDNDTVSDGNVSTDEESTANESQRIGPTPKGYDELVVSVDVRENGSATWSLEYRYRLDEDNNASDRWEDAREEIESDPDGYLEIFESNWSDRVDAAAEATGREMGASDFRLEIDEESTPQETGYIRFSFQWEEFARVELNRIEVGDSFGAFALDDRMQLIVTWPEAYEHRTIEPEPDDSRDRAAIWNGEATDFLEGEPFIELMERTAGETESESEPDSLVPVSWLVGLLLLVMVLAGTLGWWVFRPETERAHQTDSSASTPPVTGPQRPPEELLSNEERVLKLLAEEGGRMKQQEVVSTLEWTEAKTSQVVGRLREDGSIDAFRIGRENVLTLTETGEAAVPGSESGPTDATPHESTSSSERGSDTNEGN
ncbi:helix-turn-helix transcriptional regulator [Natrialbaceae archaeon A-chndr2]